MLNKYYNLQRISDAEYRIESQKRIYGNGKESTYFTDICIYFYVGIDEMLLPTTRIVEHKEDDHDCYIPRGVKEYIKRQYNIDYCKVDGYIEYGNSKIIVISEKRNEEYGIYWTYYHFIYNEDNGSYNDRNECLSNIQLFEMIEKVWSDALITGVIEDIKEELKQKGENKELQCLIEQYREDLFFYYNNNVDEFYIDLPRPSDEWIIEKCAKRRLEGMKNELLNDLTEGVDIDFEKQEIKNVSAEPKTSNACGFSIKQLNK